MGQVVDFPNPDELTNGEAEGAGHARAVTFEILSRLSHENAAFKANYWDGFMRELGKTD